MLLNNLKITIMKKQHSKLLVINISYLNVIHLRL